MTAKRTVAVFRAPFFIWWAMAEKELPTIEINGLEVFSIGKWNNDDYTLADLQQMVNAFDQVGFEPTVKAGHENGQENPATASRLFGEPALGYVKRIYIEGKKLLADLYSVPKRFGELIKAGTYKRVSAEIYWNYLDDLKKKSWPRVLKSIAFLGADIPALPNLKAIEALFTVTDGQLTAYDEQNREFRTYDSKAPDPTEMDFHGMEMPMPPSARKMAKADVNYAESGGGDASCGACRFYQGTGCGIVEGTIDYDGSCDLQKPYPNMPGMNAMTTDNAKQEHYPWSQCVQDQLGSGKSQKSAEAICGSIKAKNSSLEDVITIEEMRDLCPECAQHMERKGFKAIKVSALSTLKSDEKVTSKSGGKVMEEKDLQEKFDKMWAEKEEATQTRIRKDLEKETEYKVHKAREDGKLEILKEKERLEEDIRSLQSEKRSQRIEHWLKTMKSEGKLLPAEESKVRAMREWIPDEGPALKYFTLKAGKAEAQEMSPADLFESLYSSRSSVLFKNLSRDDNDARIDDPAQELPDAGAEVDRRAKLYMTQQEEKNHKVSYSDATRYVLSKDGALAQRYSQGRTLN